VLAGKAYHGAVRGWWVHLATLAFDLRYGVETRTIVQHDGSGRAQPGVHTYYQRTPPGRFRRIMAALDVDAGRFTFVDVGCGKGAVLLLAAKAGFRRVIGVELSEPLAASAERNIEKSRGIPKDDVAFDVVCADVTEWEPPRTPLFVFLFNPLTAEPLRTFLANLQRSLHDAPRPAYVVYAYPLARSPSFPVQVDEFDAAPFLRRIADGRGYVAYQTSEPAPA